MKVGTRLYGTDPTELTSLARRCEEWGYESLWRGEHIVYPKSFDDHYPYSADGVPPFSSTTPVLECFTVLTYLAAVTERIKLASGVCILPLRNVYLLARVVATLDVLSRGRALVGVGVGWLSEEFELMGADFGHRGRTTDEAMQALRALWTQESPTFEGRHLSIGGIGFEPKPITRPHPPLIVGGESEAALRRAASLGDGWYGHVGAPDEIAAKIAFTRAARQHGPRAGEHLEITVRVPPEVAFDEIARLAAVGVDRVVLEAGSFGSDDTRAAIPPLERFAADVLPRVQELGP